MILNDQEVTERMESPMNLFTRLRSATSASRNNRNGQIISIPPTSDEVIPDLDEKLSVGSIKMKASNIMVQAMEELKTRIPEVTKASELARIAGEMNKIVTAESEEKDKDNRPQFILYQPVMNQENKYETIYARE
jgi:hypothetical protein